jgi:uncharacterized protein
MDVKRVAIGVGIVIAVVVGAAVISSLMYPVERNFSQVCFGGNCFGVSVVDNDITRARGLMFVERLDEGTGMLFVYDRDGVYPFWMKNTLIPLDMIWVDRDRRIVFIHEDAQPCGDGPCESIDPGVVARYVVEVNAGTVRALGIRVGDVVDNSI